MTQVAQPGSGLYGGCGVGGRFKMESIMIMID